MKFILLTNLIFSLISCSSSNAINKTKIKCTCTFQSKPIGEEGIKGFQIEEIDLEAKNEVEAQKLCEKQGFEEGRKGFKQKISSCR